MNLYDSITKRKSCRSYNQQPLPDKQLGAESAADTLSFVGAI